MFKRKPKSKIEERIKEHKARIKMWERDKKKYGKLIPAQRRMWLKHAKAAVRKLEGDMRKAKA